MLLPSATTTSPSTMVPTLNPPYASLIFLNSFFLLHAVLIAHCLSLGIPPGSFLCRLVRRLGLLLCHLSCLFILWICVFVILLLSRPGVLLLPNCLLAILFLVSSC
eukprot:m.196325 g.196325  ORF g.196325 m.196325 type:complete len:106 (-) comp53743_c0_seq1:464-781(-)